MQSQQTYNDSITNKSQTGSPTESKNPPIYLSFDKQERLAIDVDRLAEKSTFLETFCYTYGPHCSVASILPLSFYSWRAGFRGYSLSKYGRGRILTIAMGSVYPFYGGLVVSLWASQKLMSPFRRENPWYHGLNYALAHSFGVALVATGNILLTFMVANKSGLLPIPDGMHKPNIRNVASHLLLSRIKPYTRGIVMSAALSTIFMFAVGAGSYYQSCSFLKKLGRKTLIEDEVVKG